MKNQVSDPARPLRALVAKRISRLTGASTHMTTEAESIEDFCARKGIEIAFSAEDLDVSGGQPIKERAGVGRYLTDEYLDSWDVLIVYKLDRGFRNHYDFVSWFHEYVDGHGKTLISVGEEGLDMSTPMGRMFAGLLVTFAEWELTRMSERRAAAQSVIRAEARWGGGVFGFGYEPFQAGGHWYLRPHPLYSIETERMAAAVIAGQAPGAVAAGMNDRGIPTARDVQADWSGRPRGGKQTEDQKAKGEQPRPYRWTGSAVISHLRSDLVRGYVLHRVEGKPPVRVTGPDGGWIRREALISDETWYQVQQSLDAAARPLSGVRSRGSALLRVAHCGCGAVLHANSSRRRDGNGKNHYYTCSARCSLWKKSIPAGLLESVVSDALLGAVGGVELTTRKVIPGDDHSQVLAKIGHQLADLWVHSAAAADFGERKAVLEAEHARIAALPQEDPEVQEVPAGVTFGQKWDAMDGDERHAYLLGAGVRVEVERGGKDDGDGKDKVIVVADDAWRAIVLAHGRVPYSEERGRALTVVKDGWRVTIHLGDLTELRARASR